MKFNSTYNFTKWHFLDFPSAVHSSEIKVFGQLNTLEKCFKICYVYGKRKIM